MVGAASTPYSGRPDLGVHNAPGDFWYAGAGSVSGQ